MQDLQDAAPGAERVPGADQAENVKVLSCINCQGPVASSAGKCFACGAPLSGREFDYVSRQDAGPDIPGLFKWWGIWSFGIFLAGGFSFGIGASIAFTAISLIYLIRILRAYYG